MELKKQDVGLMVVTIMKGLNSIDELPDQVKHIYSKMIALLFNHFQYSIQEGEFKDATLKAKAMADQQKIQETNPEMN